jgi:hypothetical protein
MSREELKAALFDLPHSERMALLVCSVIDHEKHNPVLPVLGMIKVTGPWPAISLCSSAMW